MALEAAQRANKRQAAPFCKRKGPKENPEKPGRELGKRYGVHRHREPISPERIDKRYTAPLPERCPRRGSHRIVQTHTAKQYQTEIPCRVVHREFIVHVGQYADYKNRVQGRHPLQTSDALGAAASRLVPDAYALLAVMNKVLGLSSGKCQKFFRHAYGITLSRGAVARSLHRAAWALRVADQQIQEAARGVGRVVPDETGWRVGGRNAWLHVLVAPNATYYRAGSRSRDVAAGVLGWDWNATMGHDGWAG